MACVGNDQEANAKDQEGKEKAQPVKHKRKVQPQRGQPVYLNLDDLTGQYGWKVCQQADKRRKRDCESHATTG